MNCNNCGARLQDDAKVCPNCGAFLDDGSGYTLLTSDDMEYEDYYSDDTPEKKSRKSGFIWFLSILLTLVVVGSGAYYFFENIYSRVEDAPSVSFSTGSGVINDDEKIIYASIGEDSSIEFIHGVSLYHYDAKAKSVTGAPLTTDYQYTKNINATFRAIFFDTENLELSSGENTLAFEIKLGFYDTEDIFTYVQPITFVKGENDNVADVIFDHSVQEDAGEEESTTAPAQEEESTTASTTTAAKQASFDYLYDAYWYTQPYQEEEEYIIFALKFKKDGTYTSTRYYKKGDAAFEVTTYSNTYTVEDGYAVLNNGDGTESTYYKLDAENETLSEEEEGETVSTLAARKYNSVKNAEDFFGL